MRFVIHLISFDLWVLCFHYWFGSKAQVMNGYRSGSALGLEPKLGKDVSAQNGMTSVWHPRDSKCGHGLVRGEYTSNENLVACN